MGTERIQCPYPHPSAHIHGHPRPGHTPDSATEPLLRARFAPGGRLASHARGRGFETSRAHRRNPLRWRRRRPEAGADQVVLAGRTGEVALAGAHGDVATLAEVAHYDHATPHHGQGAVAAVDGVPDRAAQRACAVAPPGPVAPAGVTAQAADDAPGKPGRAGVPAGAPGAAARAPTGEVEVGEPVQAACLPDLKDP